MDRPGQARFRAGDVAVVGAANEDGGGISWGAAYIFERDLGGADNWGQRAKLTASDAANFAEFGDAVATCERLGRGSAPLLAGKVAEYP